MDPTEIFDAGPSGRGGGKKLEKNDEENAALKDFTSEKKQRNQDRDRKDLEGKEPHAGGSPCAGGTTD